MNTGMPACAGHRNADTVKGVSFMGLDDEFVASGSDCGHLFIWSKRDGMLRNMQEADTQILNCVEPHPSEPFVLATSGTPLCYMPTSHRRRVYASAECVRLLRCAPC
jgi:WD40 repeat protein